MPGTRRNDDQVFGGGELRQRDLPLVEPVTEGRPVASPAEVSSLLNEHGRFLRSPKFARGCASP
mgnify:CR=1 FL=1